MRLFGRAIQIGVLLFRVFTATTAEVRLLAQSLHDLRLTVSTPLLPGHGTIPQDLNRVNYQDWISHLEKSFQNLKKQCNKVIVGGESTGAVIALTENGCKSSRN